MVLLMKNLEKRFLSLLPADIDFCSFRYHAEEEESVVARQNVMQPIGIGSSAGAMLTVVENGGLGYAATADLSREGILAAIERAREWARAGAACSVVDFSKVAWPQTKGEWHGIERQPWDDFSVADRIGIVMDHTRQLNVNERIVDWSAALHRTKVESLYVTNQGGSVHQTFFYIMPRLVATASDETRTQTRTLGGLGTCMQGGLEVLDTTGFTSRAREIGEEAVALLEAPNCPTGRMDVVLDPDQMILQVHESIGHPLELDRILGDERNYAGTSFVTPDMVGSYRYGSKLLNVTFDPTHPQELGSYGYDDEGRAARKTDIIRDGILVGVQGGTVSQARANLPGVANARANGWNRPPIDRMANLNMEPGSDSVADMIASVEKGVYMKTNCSWSIDDSRNKFQFGCEWGQLIENGVLTDVVRNSGYRGISATFWRNLAGVGDAQTVRFMGAPNCGKGEPNQVARVGHATPTCLFRDVQVFGGE
jgi:predicted Zn-dependent protease